LWLRDSCPALSQAGMRALLRRGRNVKAAR
jgi:hypothetical protein